jgi:hypothetical protein
MNGPSSDRNLLPGIVALEMDSIHREALIAAMRVWALQKSRPLSEILVESHDLDPSESLSWRTRYIVNIARHGADATRSGAYSR